MKSHFIIAAIATAFAASVSAQPAAPKEVNAGFTKLDKNKDGFISRAEAKGNKDMAAYFDKADLNKDGKLDEDEYLKGSSAYEREKAAQYAEDSAVTTKVKSELLVTKDLSSTRIKVVTVGGKVKLSGTVANKEQIAQAGKAAAGVSGVKAVENKLTVKN